MIPSRRTSKHPFKTIAESPNVLFNTIWSNVNPLTLFNSNSMLLKTSSSFELFTVNGISKTNLIKPSLSRESNTSMSPDFTLESGRMVITPSTLSKRTLIVSSLTRNEFPFNLDCEAFKGVLFKTMKVLL